MFPRLDVAIQDTPFDPSSNDRLVQTRAGESGQPLYRVFISLVGRDLPFVKKITYYLHESVTEPVRTVVRSPENPDCRLVAWLWGTFEVRAQVEDLKGGVHNLVHGLEYDKYFDEAKFAAEKLRLKKA